jgi:hypothetical protein
MKYYLYQINQEIVAHARVRLLVSALHEARTDYRDFIAPSVSARVCYPQQVRVPVSRYVIVCTCCLGSPSVIANTGNGGDTHLPLVGWLPSQASPARGGDSHCESLATGEPDQVPLNCKAPVDSDG